MDHGSPTRRELLTLLLSELLQEFHHRASKRWQNVSLGTNPNGAASSLAGACWMPPHPRSCPKPTPEARWTLNYHLTYLYLSYHSHLVLLPWKPAVHVDRDWDSTGLPLRGSAPPAPCLPERTLLPVAHRRTPSVQSKRLWRLPSESSPPGHVHCSNMAQLIDEISLIQAVFIYHRSIGSIIRWLRDHFWRGLFDISKAP